MTRFYSKPKELNVKTMEVKTTKICIACSASTSCMVCGGTI